MMELKTPIRIYWDLSDQESGIDVESVVEQILALKILSLNLSASAATPAFLILSILQRLAHTPVAVSLTIPMVLADTHFMDRLFMSGLKNIYLSVADHAELMGMNLGKKPKGEGIAVGVSVPLATGNYRQLPQIYAFCAKQNIPLVLPMQRLVAGGDCFTLGTEERLALAAEIATVAKPAGMQVIIHDPFLWRVFFPREPFPEGRCQGANTLLAVAASGEVHPCPAFPLNLGNLRESTLRQIVNGEGKKALREKLKQPPAECRGCAKLEECFGGCRGRGYCITGSMDGADPGCR